ncbi:hypothetical protein MOB09_19385 [Bacillus vallismortis]|uniref:hypothetical protein n=1 Tax=Bacillus vallismortis TaxID=72361 RepID=UPI0022802383|nr:hypothetical protein [Bacillus vallismortis]MCY7895117.1 hypothetical protein [Bacillus vallismortis]
MSASETKFGEIKSVLVYLEQIKKDIHTKSLSEQIEFKKEIKERHDKKQIQMLHGRLEDQFELKKAISYLVTAFFALVSLVISSTMSFSLGIIKENGLNLATAAVVIIYLFFIAVGAWVVISKFEGGRLGKLNCYKRLLQECLDEMPDKRHFRRRV